MLHLVEDEDGEWGCDNCGSHPKQLVVIRGARNDAQGSEACCRLCKRCTLSLFAEMKRTQPWKAGSAVAASPPPLDTQPHSR
jgi:hypothetical protein